MRVGLLATAAFGAALMNVGPASAATVTRAEVEAVLPTFEAMVAKAIADGEVPGLSIAIVAGDEVVYLKGFGTREAGKDEPVGPDTVFQLASFSKPISATVVAAVVGDNKHGISWDSLVTDLDPSFHLKEAWPSANLTVTDLFAHRSGLPGNAGNELEDLGFDRATIMHRLAEVPLAPFRATYSYSNFGITEGADAVAKGEGMAWADLAETRLFKPLGMTQTSARYADFLTRPDRAVLHIGGTGAWKPGPLRKPDAQAPAGGVSSSARDLATWLRLELGNGSLGGKEVIDPAALAATHVPLMERGSNPVTGGASFYGRGWNVEFGRYGLQWGDAGAFSNGARTLVSILPSAASVSSCSRTPFRPVSPKASPTRSSISSSPARWRRTGSAPGTRPMRASSDRPSKPPRPASPHRRPSRGRRSPMPPISAAMPTTISAMP